MGKCEIEVNELKVEDGEGEHDLEIDGTIVKMKTAFIKIKNRSTLSLTDLDDQESDEDIEEVSLEESLNKILSQEKIASLGEGWRKEIVRRSPHEAVIVCVKTPDNVELRSVGEAEQYLNSVGVTNVDVEKLFSSPPTPSKSLNNEVVEHEVVKELTAMKDLSETSILDSSADNPNLGKERSENNKNCSENSDVSSNEHDVDDKNVQAVSEVVEPDPTGDKAISPTTTTTDSLETAHAQVSGGEKNMTDRAVGDINDNRVGTEEVDAPSKPTFGSKKRKLVQTNMFAFLGQGQPNKKVKLDNQDTLDDIKQLPTEVEITGNLLNNEMNEILEKVTDTPLVLDDNSNVQQSDSDSQCLSGNNDDSPENLVPDELREVLEKVPEHIKVEDTVDNSHTTLKELKTGDINGLETGSQDSPDDGPNELKLVKKDSEYLQCFFCDYETKDKRDFKKHNNRKHYNENHLPPDRVDNDVEAGENDSKNSTKLKNGSKSSLLKCTQCDNAFKIANSLDLHSFYFHGAGKDLVFEADEEGHFQCEHCDHKSTKLSNIKSHVFNKHERKKDITKEGDSDLDLQANGKLRETASNASKDEDTDEVSESGDNCIPLVSSDLPEGWTRLKVPRRAVGKFDVYVQSPDGKRFNCQKKIDVYIAKNNLKLKDIKFRPIDGNFGVCKDVSQKKKKQPCKESNNIPEEEVKESQKPISSKKKKDKEVDKENKVVKKQREKKPKTEITEMCVTDKEIDESEENEELTENEIQYIAEIDQFMKETNLKLEPKPATKGDGNCWYRAAACQVILHDIPNKPRNHKSMRLEVSNHLKNLPDQVKEDTINVVYQGRPRGLKDLASRQRKAGQWVDNTGVMVLATAHYLGRNIHLYGYPTSSDSQTRLFSLTSIEGGDQADRFPPLTIFYYDRHYQTLQQADTDSPE